MIAATLRRAGTRLLDLVLPPRCAGCGTGLAEGAEAGTLCAGCWAAIEFLAPPLCRRCGYPFEIELGADELCPVCRTVPPVFDRARAVLRYDAGSRPLLLAFKHGDRTDLAPAFGRWLARVGAELLAEADLVTPVPLHWTRLFTRRYNQAALLAQAAARLAGRPFKPDLLVRRRRTAPQSAGRAARARNVAGAFLVPPGAAGGRCPHHRRHPGILRPGPQGGGDGRRRCPDPRHDRPAAEPARGPGQACKAARVTTTPSDVS